jgi:hypothetical protein
MPIPFKPFACSGARIVAKRDMAAEPPGDYALSFSVHVFFLSFVCYKKERPSRARLSFVLRSGDGMESNRRLVTIASRPQTGRLLYVLFAYFSSRFAFSVSPLKRSFTFQTHLTNEAYTNNLTHSGIYNPPSGCPW